MKYSARLVTALAALALIVVAVIGLTVFFGGPDATDTTTASSMQSTDLPALVPEGGGAALVLTNFDTATEVAPITTMAIDLPTLLEGGGPDTVVAQFDATITDDLDVARASAAPLAIATIAMLAVLAVIRGGVQFYSSASALAYWFVGLASATRRAMTTAVHVSGAGRTTGTTNMPMDITQRHVAAVDTHYIDDDGTKGFRRWLPRTGPFFAGRQV